MEQKGQKQQISCCLSRQDIHILHALELWYTCPWTDTVIPLVLGPLHLDWIYTTGFPQLPAYRWHIVGLSRHNGLSQCLIINYFLCISISPIGSVSWRTLTNTQCK